jgi:ubiquinone/menaquinone biosynthesis C-methylase UbiE
MIQEAKEKLNKYKNTEFIVCDYGNNEWLSKVTNSAQFDLIVSGFSIHHQPDIRKRELYEEFYKMLKVNGLFINIEQVLSPTKWIESIFDDLFIDSLYKMHLGQGKTISRDEVAEFWFNRPDINDNILALVETQCEWLRQIGYHDVDCYFKIFELAIFGGRK